MTTVEPPCNAASGCPESAADARGLVRALLAAEVPSLEGESPLAERTVADVLLVTSELVSNAIQHAGGLVGFAATVKDGFVRLTVSDASSRHPVRLVTTGRGRPGGYGWPLVCSVAEEVTVTSRPGGGKSVYARVRLA
jgi:anti-sigma regulatory factor (Ser/Thr protein kinase)